jgi:hypothetical protein
LNRERPQGVSGPRTDRKERRRLFLQKYEYATKRHALFALLLDTGFRLGTVRALDLDDCHPEQHVKQ